MLGDRMSLVRGERARAAIATCAGAWLVAIAACDAVLPRLQVNAAPTPAETLTVIAAPNVFRAATAQAAMRSSLGDEDADSADKAATWSTSDRNIALVNQLGMVVGRTAGSAVVGAQLDGHWIFTAVQVVDAPDPKFRIIAHRGFMRRFPENTIPAVRGSFDQGADAVEVDIRLSADGVPYVMHDPTVDRTTDGQGAVSTLHSSELATLNACARWANTPRCAVPLLADVLREAQSRGGVLLHLYGNYSMADLEKLLSMVHDAGMDRDAMFVSFEYSVLMAIRRIDPVVGLGFLTSHAPDPKLIDALGRMAPIMELQAALADSTATRAYLAAAVARRQEAGVWVAWNQLQAQQAAALGFRTIIADVPIDRSTLLP
jgi:glycerophosphoryl diester phosphodiesterase